jgi:hypothetical protein
MWKFTHEFRYFVIYFSNENSAKHKQEGLTVVAKRDSNSGSYCVVRQPFFAAGCFNVWTSLEMPMLVDNSVNTPPFFLLREEHFKLESHIIIFRSLEEYTTCVIM